MRIDILTLFPDFFRGPLEAGLLGRARDEGIVSVALHNPRDHTTDRHHTVDDRPYGGGPGMVMMLAPLVRTLEKLGHVPLLPAQRGCEHPHGDLRPDFLPTELPGSGGDSPPAETRCPSCIGSVSVASTDPLVGQEIAGSHHELSPMRGGRILMMSPRGKPFTQAMAAELAREDRLTILCGRYEGFDARLDDVFAIEPISLGDFVLNGGETAAMAVVEAVCRLVPGFMGHAESGEEESFSGSLLEYPHYTRPESYRGLPVPAILRSGDHGAIAAWRRERSVETTFRHRPDLLADAQLSEMEMDSLKALPRDRVGRNLYCALVHYPVLDREKNSLAVSLTNLDIHDIARSSCSYGLGGYVIVTPLEDQRRLLRDILHHWVEGPGSRSNPDRARSLRLVREAKDIAEAVTEVAHLTGEEPLVVATSARGSGSMSYRALRDTLSARPVLLLFGTGHGLSQAALDMCHAVLPPIRWHGEYNHLSVRSAAAIVMDRILGDWY